MREYWPQILGIVITVGIYRNLWGPGIPMTHDGPLHVVRMVNYYLALRQGQIPPRIGPNLANGLGYPVFNYNYPLATALGALLIRAHIPFEKAYILIMFGFLVVGGVGWSLLLRHFQKTKIIQLLGFILFTANTMMLSQVFVRGGPGEIAFISLLPWVLWFACVALSNQLNGVNRAIFSILIGVLLLAHNVLVLIGVPFMVISLIILKGKLFFKSFRNLLVPGILGLGMACFFWIPAILEKNLTILDEATINSAFRDHFISISQLWSGFWGYGFSRPGPVDGLLFRLNIVEIVAFFLALSLGLIKKQVRGRLFGILVLTLMIMILMTTKSELLWDHFDILHYVQFPWRFLWFVHLLINLMICFWLDHWVNRKKWLIVWLAIGLMVVESNVMAKPQYRVHRDDQTWIQTGETTSTMNENLPKTLDLNPAYQILEKNFQDRLVWLSEKSGQVNIDHWDGSKRSYNLTITEPTIIVERTAFFSGWETRANGKLLSVSEADPWKVGLLTYQLMPGTYQIKTVFSQNTTPRRVGNFITILSFGLMMSAIVFEKFRAAKRVSK